jgi:hypothetical protein
MMLRIYTVLFLIYNSYLLVSDSIQTIFWLLFLHFLFFFFFERWCPQFRFVDYAIQCTLLFVIILLTLDELKA